MMINMTIEPTWVKGLVVWLVFPPLDAGFQKAMIWLNSLTSRMLKRVSQPPGATD
jgi:hypothetical protein